MKLNLRELHIRNFKGIKELDIELGHTTDIMGANATGKTSIYDAYLWLLFGKDSSDRATFGLKPLTKDGEEIHNLETEVEGIFELNGQSMTLKKVYSEKWTKKRGSATEEFTGHTTECFWDDVPINASEYKDKLYNLIDEDAFKLLSNPAYFSTVMKEKDRRDMLMRLIGDVKDEDIIAKDKRLQELAPLLVNRTIDDVTKMQKASATKINSQIKEIPARIDELERSIVEKDFDDIKAQIKMLGNALETAHKRSESKSKVSERIDELEAQKRKLQRNLQSIGVELELARQDGITKQRATVNNLKAQLEEVEFEKKRILDDKKIKEQILDNADKINETLRATWSLIASEQWQGETTCPTCKQAIPEDQIEDAQVHFETHKRERLEEIKRKGKIEKEKIARLMKEIEAVDVTEQDKYIDIFKADIEKATQELKTLTETPITPTDEIVKIQDEILEIDRELIKLEKDDAEDTAQAAAQKEIAQLAVALDALHKELAYEDTNARAVARIEELEKEQRELGRKYEDTQRLIVLCETFSRLKMDTISDSIDGKFQLVKWKLYEEQINGGIRDICKATIQGVPYEDANNASKINAGLDIINTLGAHLDTIVPVFVDNAEAVNRLIETQGQVVRLTVTTDKKLKINGGN